MFTCTYVCVMYVQVNVNIFKQLNLAIMRLPNKKLNKMVVKVFSFHMVILASKRRKVKRRNHPSVQSQI